MNKWKIKSQNIVFSQKLFKVKKQKILLPNGKEREYSIVERQPISVIFPISDKLELYLISQFRYLFDKKILEAVAGHIDEGETPLEAAKRELKEEKIELVKMSIENAIKKIMDGEIKTAATIIGVFLLDKLNKEGRL